MATVYINQCPGGQVRSDTACNAPYGTPYGNGGVLCPPTDAIRIRFMSEAGILSLIQHPGARYGPVSKPTGTKTDASHLHLMLKVTVDTR